MRYKTSEASKENTRPADMKSKKHSNSKVNSKHPQKCDEAKEYIPAYPPENSFLEIKSLLVAMKDNLKREKLH